MRQLKVRCLLGLCGVVLATSCDEGVGSRSGTGGTDITTAGTSGTSARGGAPGTAGTISTGGVASTGESVATGGNAAGGGSGGAAAGSGGAKSSGGATGGSVSSGGIIATGGRGGSTASGGSVGSGGNVGGNSEPAGARDAGPDAVVRPGDASKDGPSTLGAVVFSKNIRLNDDNGSGEQSEVAMAVGPGSLVIAGWMDSRSERVCAFTVSADGGLTWSKNVSIGITSGTVTNPTANFVGDPSVAIDASGNLYAVCMDYGMNQIKMMTSTDGGKTWSKPASMQEAPDKPWVTGGVADSALFMSWLGTSAGIKRSLDMGKTWGPIQSIGNIIHGTAIVTSTTQLVHVPFNLDSDRNQLRYVRSTDNGQTWEKPRDLVSNMGTFCFNCSPRQHPIVGAGADPTGKNVAITWASTMSGGDGDDDVWLMYSKNGGDTWTKPLRVNDNKTASRQFQSWVAVDNYGRVHVVWTDFRDNGQNETFYARSADPEKGFEANVQVTDGRGSGAFDFLGDYKGIAVQGADVLVVWEDTRRGNGDIYFSKATGAAGP